jgi:hypothetical protein
MAPLVGDSKRRCRFGFLELPLLPTPRILKKQDRKSLQDKHHKLSKNRRWQMF